MTESSTHNVELGPLLRLSSSIHKHTVSCLMILSPCMILPTAHIFGSDLRARQISIEGIRMQNIFHSFAAIASSAPTAATDAAEI